MNHEIFIHRPYGLLNKNFELLQFFSTNNVFKVHFARVCDTMSQ